MAKPKQKTFSLYSWLLKKLRNKLILWYFFTFLSSLFYYQATAGGLNLWKYEGTSFPCSLLFGIIPVNSRSDLLLYSFFCFFIGSLLTILVCEYLKNYSLELGRNYLRKLILNYSMKNPSRPLLEKREVLNSFLIEVELFTPLFILTPQKIFAAVVNIILTFIFLTNFQPNNFSIYFIIFISLAVALLSFLTYRIQSQINQKLNRFRQQENVALEKYLANQTEPQKVKCLINSNFRKTRSSLSQKTLSYLPTLIIPGLSILFCFIYSVHHGNWETVDFVRVGAIAGSIQTIFWKVKDITDNLPEFSKIKVHYKPLQKVLSKLRRGK